MAFPRPFREHRLTIIAAALLPSALMPTPVAQAQETRAPQVVVTATRIEENAFDLPVAIDALGPEELRNGQWQVNASEALVRVPGIGVQNRQSYAQDLQVSSRGFGARAQFGVRGIRLIADDIPSSMPDGQGSTGNFDLASAARIEVLRGPFSALYGNHAGGVIQLFTEDGPEVPTVQASAAAGSYGSQRLGLKAGGQSGAFNYTVSAADFQTDGYRDHSAAKRQTANAKLRLDASSDDRVTLVANTLDQPDNQDPLGLTAAAMAANPRQATASATTFNTRRSLSNTQGGLTWEHRIGENDRLRATTWAGQRENEQFQAIPLATQNGPRHSGGVATIDRDFGGAALRWSHSQGAVNWAAGTEYERMVDDRKGYINNNGVKGALKRDEENTVAATGVYGQFEWALRDTWLLSGGLRYSRVTMATDDHFITASNPNDSGNVRFSKTTPTVGLLHKLSSQTNLYANLGRGFETPTNVEIAYKPDQTSGPNLNLRPAVSDSVEAGVKTFLTPNSRLNAAVFAIRTKDEIVIVSNLGGRAAFQNAGRSERRGVELAFDAQLPAGFSTYASATVLSARYKEAFATCAATPCNPTSGVGTATVGSDNRIPGVAARTAFAELVWKTPARGFEAALEWRYNDKVYVNDLNSEAAASYSLANARAGLRQTAGKWDFNEFVRIDNLGDKRYVSGVLVGDANGRYYAPGAERNWLAGVSGQYRF